MITIEEALASGHGTWRSFTCPKHDDSSPSARVNVETGKWVCMSCGAKGHSENYHPDPDMLIDSALRDLESLDARKFYAESWLDQFDASGADPGEYWLSRFSRETCRKHRFGYDWTEEKSVYPFRDDEGQVLGVVRRGHPGEKPKYRYPWGVDASAHLFGYHRRLDREPSVVVLCEGAPDTAAVTDVEDLLDALSGETWLAMGCYGKVLHARQRVLVHRARPDLVLVAFNGDEAGRKGQWLALRQLEEEGLQAVGVNLPYKKDLGDLRAGQRITLLHESLSLSTIV